MHDACARHEEDLALLAGGDLPATAESSLRLHLEGCKACEALLVDLTADQCVIGRVANAQLEDAAQPDEAMPVMAGVLARLAIEAHEDAVRRMAPGHGARGMHGARTARQRRLSGLGAFGRAAAVVAIVVSASLLGLSALNLDDAGSPDLAQAGAPGPTGLAASGLAASGVAASGLAQQGATAAPSTREPGIPLGLRVRRASTGVELTWVGDGRESGRSGRVETYHVSASANPRDFSEGPPVEVAGRQLVADLPISATGSADRKLTYFRLE
jgi:hypothetical protein